MEIENSKNENEKAIGSIIDNYENKYDGEIINGQANGFGTKTYKDGRIYKGFFKNNKREGKGELIRPDGTKFIGIYKNDVQEGEGMNITKDGRKELLKWLEDDSKNDPIRSPMLMKVFFRGECSLDENIEYFKDLAQKESVFPDNGEIVKDKSNEYVNNIDDPLKALYWKFTIDFGVMYSKMVREWCEKCVNELEVIKNEGSIN